MTAAELALAARTEATQADIRAELWEHRRLAKTWTLRGTLHLHAADELPLWTAAARRIHGGWPEAYGIDAADGQRVVDAIGDALDGRCLLREELADEVARRAGAWTRERISSGWGYLIGEAAAEGRLCHGPPRGTKVTFVRPDQWFENWRELDPSEALREVCRRYLDAFGPAAPKHFAEWFGGMKPADARTLFESLADELEEVDVEGTRAWLAAPSLDDPPSVASVRLLPEYDCYVMGFRERERLVPEVARGRMSEHGRGRYEGPAGVPWLLVGGVVAGWWQRKKRTRKIELRVETFGRLTRPQRSALEAEASRIGAFFGLEADLVVDTLGE